MPDMIDLGQCNSVTSFIVFSKFSGVGNEFPTIGRADIVSLKDTFAELAERHVYSANEVLAA